MKHSIHICSFDSGASELKGKKLTYEAVKALVLEAGRYSVFEATQSDRLAEIFTRLAQDPELKITPAGFPWHKVERVDTNATKAT